MEVSIPIQLAGLTLLVAFAASFGARWGVLAAALVLLFIGFVLSGVTVTLRRPPRPARPARLPQGEDHI